MSRRERVFWLTTHVLTCGINIGVVIAAVATGRVASVVWLMGMLPSACMAGHHYEVLSST